MKKEPKQRKGDRRSPRPRRTQRYPADWVPIQAPPNLDEMFLKWIESDEPNIGICLRCGDLISTEADLIPGTAFHNCADGRALEQDSRDAEKAAKANPRVGRKPPRSSQRLRDRSAE